MSSGNLLYDFDTEDEAISAVRELIALNGPGTTGGLVLVFVDGDRMATIAQGHALEAYAQQTARASAPGSG